MYWYSTIGYILHQSFEHRFDRKLSEKRVLQFFCILILTTHPYVIFCCISLLLTSPVHHPHEGHKLDFCILGVDDWGPFETCLFFRGWKDINSTRLRQNSNVDQTNGLRSGSCVTELLNTQVFSGSVQWILLEISWIPLVGNWWFGAQWFGFRGSPKMKGIVTWG